MALGEGLQRVHLSSSILPKKGLVLLASSTEADQCEFSYHWKECSLALLMGTKHSCEASWPRICCHIVTKGDIRRRNLSATDWGPVIRESAGQTRLNGVYQHSKTLSLKVRFLQTSNDPQALAETGEEVAMFWRARN